MNKKIKMLVTGIALLMSCEVLFAQVKLIPAVNMPDLEFSSPYASNRELVTSYPSPSDTMLLELHYAHNFQSGFPSLDSYLDIRILNSMGKKMKKGAIRSVLSDNPLALSRYNTGVRLYTTASVLGVASLGVLIVRLSNPSEKRLWMWCGIGCSTGVVICRLVGTSKLKSAINLHNGSNVNRRGSNLVLNVGVPSSGGLGFTLLY
jgi:hypothetical protein